MGDIEYRTHQASLPTLPSDLMCQVDVRLPSAVDLSELQSDGLGNTDEVIVLI